MTNDQDNSDNVELLVAERGPTVIRIALGSRLRRLRESCGVSREAAGDAIRGSHAKISRLELGRTGFKERDIRDLLTLYGVTDDDKREPYLDMARKANDPGWWQSYSDLLPAWFETYVGLEQAATTIRTYEAQFIPGLLQTADYARSVIMLGNDDETERRVAVRMRRQKILHRRAAPTLWAVIDENALRRPVGGMKVLREQIEHLITISDMPNVRIQVLPYSAGGHSAAGGPFSILRFPEPELPDIVYTEQLTSSLYMEKRHDVELYMSVMNQLSVQALSPAESLQFLSQILADYAARD
ncbi:helix-turn-helix domain-containing protein [Nocardia cyriacigeorgica]|jgi:transcriptional regulator with XRE-family HTH domain|uniref:helix-turn-helix domain-containing protein n=1 Tax=Nocardia cyriacigeorgica TaxID=135487 RepID=UPI00031BAD30|nr:helix-turn-helix transcriptional regulator [Nocardia cyriacigeorgica]AVH23478.1 XRE family transcriptional regulator [Nocardia cyriacigeorgica]MBF6088310.1 helix-turn-helix domain-containing protein [Nocardia cyriacigeorgica]MBF6095417.1 helix-turn-helix domain-containing protein [Nocardia cyriacigeorgica]MBF6323049.1 helix-turn-helix domain-containing protein [Nocardia cyriacigeorgica]MBF6396598.1 helix-turn-helix domain-containing protein [Nocardia cyriacigeorgica]